MSLKGRLLYEGKAKKVYQTESPNQYLISYKDDATAFNGQKKAQISGKGIINNLVANHLFKLLEKEGIETHLIEQINNTDTLVKNVEIIQVEVILRNKATGSLTKRLGIKEGTEFKNPVIEFCLKSDELGDPIINDDHAIALNLATAEELSQIRKYTYKINDFLKNYLKDVNIDLIDFKLEFGRFENRVILADEISPDTCRFWDSTTYEKLDKDRFRQNLGKIEESYKEILNRLMGK